MSKLKTILLKFAGPLQSWGTDSHFETRHTDYYPSKSAVIGLLAAAAGYSRSDDEKISKFNDFGFAVRIDQQGNLLKDFHVAQKYKADGSFERNYVTNRYYIEDAVYVVAVSGADSEIEGIYACLKKPCFQLFMGRRSLPVTADFLLGIFDDDLMNTLEKYPWQAAQWYRLRNYDSRELYLDVYVDSNKTEAIGWKLLRRDYVYSFSQKERSFGLRSETHYRVKVINTDYQPTAEHDIFSFI